MADKRDPSSTSPLPNRKRGRFTSDRDGKTSSRDGRYVRETAAADRDADLLRQHQQAQQQVQQVQSVGKANTSVLPQMNGVHALTKSEAKKDLRLIEKSKVLGGSEETDASSGGRNGSGGRGDPPGRIVAFNPPLPAESTKEAKKERFSRWEARPEDIDADLKAYKDSIKASNAELEHVEAERLASEQAFFALRAHCIAQSRLLRAECVETNMSIYEKVQRLQEKVQEHGGGVQKKGGEGGGVGRAAAVGEDGSGQLDGALDLLASMGEELEALNATKMQLQAKLKQMRNADCAAAAAAAGGGGAAVTKNDDTARKGVAGAKQSSEGAESAVYLSDSLLHRRWREAEELHDSSWKLLDKPLTLMAQRERDSSSSSSSREAQGRPVGDYDEDDDSFEGVRLQKFAVADSLVPGSTHLDAPVRVLSDIQALHGCGALLVPPRKQAALVEARLRQAGHTVPEQAPGVLGFMWLEGDLPTTRALAEEKAELDKLEGVCKLALAKLEVSQAKYGATQTRLVKERKRMMLLGKRLAERRAERVAAQGEADEDKGDGGKAGSSNTTIAASKTSSGGSSSVSITAVATIAKGKGKGKGKGKAKAGAAGGAAAALAPTTVSTPVTAPTPKPVHTRRRGR